MLLFIYYILYSNNQFRSTSTYFTFVWMYFLKNYNINNRIHEKLKEWPTQTDIHKGEIRITVNLVNNVLASDQHAADLGSKWMSEWESNIVTSKRIPIQTQSHKNNPTTKMQTLLKENKQSVIFEHSSPRIMGFVIPTELFDDFINFLKTKEQITYIQVNLFN